MSGDDNFSSGFLTRHHENMPVKCTPPYTPLLYSKTGLQGYTLFSYFRSKTYNVGTR